MTKIMSRSASGTKAKVLIIDDSAVVREVMSDVISSDPRLEVLGTAQDPYVAAQRLRKSRPDVITLDVEMPRMDGVTFLRKLMAQHPIPVIMCSSLVTQNSKTLMQALEAGAVDIVCKPQMGVKGFLEEQRTRICDAVYAASRARVATLREQLALTAPKLSADVMLEARAPSGRAMARTTEQVVAIGSSTGGTEALRVVLQALPPDCPPIVIVQHMPQSFTAAFAARLDQQCRVSVKEASDGDRLLRGRVLIAPGGLHTMLRRNGANYVVQIKDGPLVSRHKPSVDVLFRSVAQYAGPNALGVIMTGMGDDGSRGLKEMRDAGAHTVGQNEETCVVYGMPKEAMLAGAVVEEVPLSRISREILRIESGGRR